MENKNIETSKNTSTAYNVETTKAKSLPTTYNAEASKSISNTNDVKTSDDNQYMQEYGQFYFINVEPKVQELVAAQGTKARRKIQREILAIIKNAGYHNEAYRMRALFNL
ncbi:hypothetical protein M5J14_21690 [Lysinibacillus sp. OL1_EC]|uniref:hypothetical protein n=1 Tax=unclassified Lysinibacillus TaxID=2636778 RepID=UPI00103A8C5D|nr:MULTISPECIES: hypothetical protein [unclassified Lysinibacillus]MCM0627113.1 hypothetical protein [Lysinibacillus sp. OL1_EC]TBV84784.1 hypothetical protein EW028_24140 [Lysinibacillus sp. OL1]UKJ47761.1 hypothetical protein L6W14_22975 [Lysinibacillus sp. ACHW1.5]